ncbi:MAG TPA: dihydrodipicolinate synthase family protein [Anaerolineales bacterium]|nr:dihydrodipicolinate synthase family protein [Anaerolineales bacterium]
MNPDNPFYGLVCPILTPFDENGQIDPSAARKLVDFLVEQEVDGLMPGGTTGEGMLLTIEERKRLAEIVVEQAAGRTKVIVHTGCISTAETVELSVHARQVGADAVSVITPYFYAINDEALFKHYLAVAEAVPDTPISLYCYPDNAKQMISTELVCRLRRAAPNILAIKFSSVDLIQFQEYIAAGGEGFHALCGVDAIALSARAAGACGQVSGNANVFPQPFRKLYAAFSRGDLLEARHQQAVINHIRAVLKDDIAYFKAALVYRGIPVGNPRPPIPSITRSQMEELGPKIQALELLSDPQKGERSSVKGG